MNWYKRSDPENLLEQLWCGLQMGNALYVQSKLVTNRVWSIVVTSNHGTVVREETHWITSIKDQRVFC